MTMRTGRVLFAPMTLAFALGLGACSGDGADETVAEAAGVPAQASDRTDGILRVGERTFAFRVMRGCDLSDAEIGSPDEMLRGTGVTEDGKRFTVVVDRGSVGSGLIHTVGVTYGDIMAGTGYRAEAVRTRTVPGWSGDYNQPLIQVEGRMVRAEGSFKVDSAGVGSVVEGRLEVTCPS